MFLFHGAKAQIAVLFSEIAWWIYIWFHGTKNWDQSPVENASDVLGGTLNVYAGGYTIYQEMYKKQEKFWEQESPL